MAQSGASVLSFPRRSAAATRGLLPACLVAILLAGSAAIAGGVAVQAVEVRLTIEGPAPPEVVRARLHETVATVAQRLLVGRPVDQLRPAQAQLQTTLAQVVGRVISGYAVTEAQIEVTATAVVSIRLRPTPPLIQGVEVVPRVGVDPAVAPLVLGPLEGVLAPTRSWLLGLPVDALDWAGPLLAEEIRRGVEGTLPGFTAAARVVAAPGARVDIEVVPRDGRVVRDIGVRFRSGSIPQVLLEQHGPAVLSMAEPLRGLPVIFAERHRAALEDLVAGRLRAYGPVTAYRIVARPVLAVAETTYVTVVADSLLYLGRVEAAVNVGTNAPPAELRLHLGRLAGRFEVFGEVGLEPNTLSTRFDLGVRYQFDERWVAGASVRLNLLDPSAWVGYRLTPDLEVTVTYAITPQTLQGSLRYRVTEYLSGELVGTSEGKYWIRVISNL